MENNQTKICSKCKVEKEISLFGVQKDKKDGHCYHCKECRKVYYLLKRNMILEQKKEYATKNKEKIKERNKRYNSTNKEELLKRRRLVRESNREKFRKYAEEYRLKNKERLYAHKESNVDKIKAKSKAYYEANKEAIAKSCRDYCQTPKGKAVRRNKDHKRRVIKSKGDVTTEQLLELQQNTNLCYWCGVSLKKVKVHIDHYVPLSKDGNHTISNLVISCDKCNMAKRARDPLEFAQSLGRLL